MDGISLAYRFTGPLFYKAATCHSHLSPDGNGKGKEIMKIFAGIDVGSRAVKLALIDERERVIAQNLTDQGVNLEKIAQDLLIETLSRNSLNEADIQYIVATGYGRERLEFAHTTITEITCHARGVHQQHPAVRTIIDIGGQDSKLIRLDERGKVRDFVMNDRCAAGTGRFLEVVSKRLDIEVDDLGDFAERARLAAAISSMCVVFAETEIIGLLADGAERESIVAGVQKSIGSRIAAMAGRTLEEPVFFTGGVALISGMCGVLESALERSVNITRNPQLSGALGASLLARDNWLKQIHT
jgi:(R)-2-hydroxyacyl-CoA dehydratese activating ATPase